MTFALSISGNNTEKWDKYFENLSSPDPFPVFDQEYKESVDRQRIVIRSLKTQDILVTITEGNISDIVRCMRNNTASDFYGIKAE